MIETYKECFKQIWKGITEIFAGILVLLPSIVLLIIMFINGTPDIPTWQVVVTGIINILWAPVPLFYFFGRQYKSIRDFYIDAESVIVLAFSIIPIILLYIALCALPLVLGLAYCYVLDYKPGLEAFGVIVFTFLWAPGMHYFITAGIEKFINKDKEKIEPVKTYDDVIKREG